MIKEQVLILKVKYEDEGEKSPHTWNWTELVGSGHEVEIMNHGAAEKAE